MTNKLYNIIAYLLLLSSPPVLAAEYHQQVCDKEKKAEQKIFIFDKKDGNYQLVSPFHGIDLFPENKDNIVNMVVEIPQGTQAKMEINKSLKHNPLMFDIRDDKIRTITYKAKHTNIAGYPFHYGALPQTWEHSGKKDPHTKLYGDNDPIDAFDISPIKRTSGDIVVVKVLGAIAMIDNNETDWKLIVINVDDPQAEKYNDITDVPWGIMDTIYDFLLNYKTSEGKGQNEFYKKIYWNHKEAMKIIHELHDNWKELCQDPQNTAKIIEDNRPDKLEEMPQCSIADEQREADKPYCPNS